jgi:hypothetical protein
MATSFHVGKPGLAPGTVLHPGNWGKRTREFSPAGKVLTNATDAQNLMWELALETARLSAHLTAHQGWTAFSPVRLLPMRRLSEISFAKATRCTRCNMTTGHQRTQEIFRRSHTATARHRLLITSLRWRLAIGAIRRRASKKSSLVVQ